MHNKHRRLWILGTVPVFFALLLALFSVIRDAKPVSAHSFSGDPPIPHITQADRGWVDPTNTVDADTMESLRQASDRVESEGFQLAGTFFSDIASDPSQFASDFGNANGIGSANKDNGLVIIVLLDRAGTDGNKPYIFVAPGRGLEGLLNDAKITRFREAFFNPLRAQGKWQQGLIQLSNKFAAFLASPDAKEFSDENLQTMAGDSQSGDVLGWITFGALFVVGLIVFFFLRRGVFRGGGSGGSSGGRTSWWSSSSSGSSSGGSYGGGGGFGGGGTGG
jgi:uncharacterized protein